MLCWVSKQTHLFNDHRTVYNRKSEPVTAGLPFGPGINPQPQQQVLKAEEVRDFIYNSWLETGDDSLLEYI